MAKEEKDYVCLRCGATITKQEYETYDGLCSDCYEIEMMNWIWMRISDLLANNLEVKKWC